MELPHNAWKYLIQCVDKFNFSYTLAETYGEEGQSILNTAELWTQNISVFIGPQETCNHEAKMAAAFNLPMISHFCSDARTSNKVKVLPSKLVVINPLVGN
jgi:hypothetical protein